MEVVLASSPVDAGIACWDLRTGAEILRYRSCASAPHGLASVSSRLLACSQLPSPSVLYWSWDKPQTEVRSFPAEPISPLLSNSEGTFLLGGAKSGAIYLWEVSSGRLLKKWQAHYRSVTCLSFSDDESLLVSGSEDGSVRVWLLMMLFDDEGGNGSVRPMLHSFTEHTLTVTALVCGYGMSNSIAVSSSEDRTCKIWSLSKGKLLRSVTFPSVINAIAMDPGENVFYAGGRDGKIYIAALNAQCFSSSSYGMHIIGCMVDQSKCITSLAFSIDGVTLVSGSEDGYVRAWDTRSQHVIRVFKHAKGPINNVLIVRNLFDSSAQGQPHQRTSSSRKHSRLPMPPPLEKYYSMADGLDTKPIIEVQYSSDKQLHSKCYSYHVMEKLIEDLEERSSGATEIEVERLRIEHGQATGQALKWKNMYHDLHKLCVDEILDAREKVDDSH